MLGDEDGLVEPNAPALAPPGSDETQPVTVHAQGREKLMNLIREAGQDEFAGDGIRDGMGWPLAQAVTASQR